MADRNKATRKPQVALRSQHRVSRRSLLQVLGLGTAATAVATGAGHDGTSAAQESSSSEPSTIGTRAAGGPAADDVLWDLEFDTEQIFRFVADEVAYEAYAGALRGAKGTQWGLAGNSVDQALLLAELLTQAQIPVRFAAGELDDDTADMLLESMRLDADGALALTEKLGTSDQIALDQHPDLTPEQREAMQSPEALREELLERARERLDDGITAIEEALSGADISLPDFDLALPERERNQHVWVQYADGATWVDLDPSVPEAEPGQAYAKQTETWEALPDDMYHRVRFRAVIEKLTGGEAVREDSFDREIRAADLVGVPVVFAHVDAGAFKDLGVSITGFIDGTLQYVPTLLMGDDGESGTPVTIGGGAGALDVFGTGESDGQATAEWLDIEVLPVDASPRRVTREVFDRIGIDRRASGDVDLDALPEFELIDTPELGQVFLPLESVWVFGVVGGRVPASYFAQDYSIPDIQADMATLVHGYHAARDALQSDLAADHGYRWYLSEPNVTAAIVAPVELDGDQLRVAPSLDIVHQGYGMVPLEGETQSDHPEVIAGVLAHVAERIGADAAAVLATEAPPPSGSVSQVFEAAASSGIAIRTLTAETSNLNELDISDVALARIEAALEEGFIVVVPERAVDLDGIERVGWWQVDPQSGRTFDLMENGRGFAPLGEDTMIKVGGPAWRAIEAFKNLGSFRHGIRLRSRGRGCADGLQHVSEVKRFPASRGCPADPMDWVRCATDVDHRPTDQREKIGGERISVHAQHSGGRRHSVVGDS